MALFTSNIRAVPYIDITAEQHTTKVKLYKFTQGCLHKCHQQQASIFSIVFVFKKSTVIHE